MKEFAIDLDIYDSLAEELTNPVDSTFIVIYRINQKYPKPFLELLWNTETQSLPNFVINSLEINMDFNEKVESERETKEETKKKLNQKKKKQKKKLNQKKKKQKKKQKKKLNQKEKQKEATNK